MKLSIMTALALAAVAACPWRAQACNPLASQNFGKHVAATVMPEEMLARNYPAVTKGGSIVGLWHDVHTASDGSLFLEGYDTWNGSGTENELGNLPPATGALCVGVWKRVGGYVQLTTHVAWLYNLDNSFGGTLNITELNKVSSDGNSYTGTFTANFFGPNGNKFMQVKGTTAAERLVQ